MTKFYQKSRFQRDLNKIQYNCYMASEGIVLTVEILHLLRMTQTKQVKGIVCLLTQIQTEFSLS